MVWSPTEACVARRLSLADPTQVLIYEEPKSLRGPQAAIGDENDPDHLAPFRYKVQLSVLHEHICEKLSQLKIGRKTSRSAARIPPPQTVEARS